VDENKGSDMCLLLCRKDIGRFDLLKAVEPLQPAICCHTLLIKLKKIIYYDSYTPGNFAGKILKEK